MDFEIIRKQAEMLNPANNMAKRSVPVEIRLDPLTKRTARICHFMKLSWQKPDLAALARASAATCPFCPEKVLKITPCFPGEIVETGRMTLDDLVLFPNLAPYDAFGAVATFGDRHYIPMTEISVSRMVKGFTLAFEFFRALQKLGHPEARYHIINWNYMPPAGSSLIHPHLQVFSTSSAPNLMKDELSASLAYQEKTGRNFWEDLAKEEEKTRERFLGTVGRSVWLTAFAPMGVAGDVLAIVPGVRSTLELTESDLKDMAEGLTKVMAAYDKMGIYSFNMNFFTGAPQDGHTCFHLLFSPRTFFNQALGTPDIGALRNLFNETLCMAFPEEINRMIRPFFAS